MATLRIDSNETFQTEVTVRESDKYTQMVYVKFDRNYLLEEIRGCDEMFLTPAQLDQLGRFLVRQADAIRIAQRHREVI
jgi:hypothetical protein